MKLLKQMIVWCALGGILAGSPTLGAGPYSTFTRSSPYAEATPVEALLNGTANQGLAQAAIIQAQAAMIKASADAVEALARAADLREKTRSVYLDNQMKKVKNFYERKQLHDSFVATRERKRPTKEDLIRYSKSGIPGGTGNVTVASSRNTILWPEILQGEEFAESRIALDCLFQQRRPEDAGVGSRFCREVRQAAQKMQEQLHTNVEQFHPAEYMAARRFLEALVREAEVPKGVAGLAAR